MSNIFGSLTGHGILLVLTFGLGNIPYAAMSFNEHMKQVETKNQTNGLTPFNLRHRPRNKPDPYIARGLPPYTRRYKPKFGRGELWQEHKETDPWEKTKGAPWEQRSAWFARYGHLDTGDVTVYVLKLEDDCWYVGQSANIERRFDEHKRGDGPEWTQIHEPIEIYEVTRRMSREEATEAEKLLTIDKMVEHSWRRVRGGPWTSPNMAGPPNPRQFGLEGNMY